MKGLFLTHAGRRDEGIELVRKGVRLDLTSHICWHVFGIIQKGEKNYEEALKRAFLGTDEDLLAGETIRATPPPTRLIPLPLLDPAHVRDPSGCTAVAALITADNKIYVVRVTCTCARPRLSSSPPPRQMRAIPDPSSPIRVLLSP